MPALSTSNYDFIVNATGNPGGNVPVDMRDAMMRLLLDMGFTQFIIANTAPTDQSALWWHKDIKTAKRYSVAIGNWTALTPGLHALHLMQACVAAASAEGTIEAADLIPFYDVSAKEVKKITRDNLKLALSGTLLGNLKVVGYAYATFSGVTPTYVETVGIEFVSYAVSPGVTVFKSLGNYGTRCFGMWFKDQATDVHFIGSFNTNQTCSFASPPRGLIILSFG